MWDKNGTRARPRKSSVDRTIPRSRNLGFVGRTVASLFGWYTVSQRKRRYSNESLPLYEAGGGSVQDSNPKVVLVAAAGLLVFIGLYWFRNSSVIQPGDYPLPPLYRYYHEQELALPQHDPSLPSPEGANAKFLWLPNHVHSECPRENFISLSVSRCLQKSDLAAPCKSCFSTRT